MKIILYKDKQGEWRWRIKSPHGRILAVSSESYHQKDEALKVIKDILDMTEYHIED